MYVGDIEGKRSSAHEDSTLSRQLDTKQPASYSLPAGVFGYCHCPTTGIIDLGVLVYGCMDLSISVSITLHGLLDLLESVTDDHQYITSCDASPFTHKGEHQHMEIIVPSGSLLGYHVELAIKSTRFIGSPGHEPPEPCLALCPCTPGASPEWTNMNPLRSTDWKGHPPHTQKRDCRERGERKREIWESQIHDQKIHVYAKRGRPPEKDHLGEHHKPKCDVSSCSAWYMSINIQRKEWRERERNDERGNGMFKVLTSRYL